MSTAQRTRVRTGDPATEWSRLVADLQRCGLLSGPGAGDAVARVGADLLARAADASRTERRDQSDAP